LDSIDIGRALAGLCVVLLLGGCDSVANADSDDTPTANDRVVLDTELKEASYLIGYQQAQALAQQAEGAVEMAAYVQGVTDFAMGSASQVSLTERQRLMQALQTALQAHQAEASQSMRVAGDNYRAEYAKKDGVVALPSGLLYEVMTDASGAKPKPTDTVTTHYHGTLIDGTVFDSSVERGQPASFPVNGVIAGWTEALQLMSVGSKWRLVIPPDLAYGDRGAGADIKPGATLVFEVELLEIK